MNMIRISSIAVTGDRNHETSFTRELRRADRFTNLAVTVSEQALSCLPASSNKTETGIFIGTAYGPLATNFAALDTLLNDGEGQMSPTLFSHSVFNTAAGYISRLFEIQGPAFTFTNYSWPFFRALEEGKAAINRNMITRAIIIGVEIYSRVLTDAGHRLIRKNFPVLEAGAVAWILEDEAEAADNRICLLDSVEFEEKPAQPEYLISPHPLIHALSVSHTASQLKHSGNKTEIWSAEELFGKAQVRLQSS